MLALRYGTTPAQLRACTVTELDAMAELLLELQAAQERS